MGAGIISSGVRALPEKRRLFNSGSTAANLQPKDQPQSYQSLSAVAVNDSAKQKICRQLLGPMH